MDRLGEIEERWKKATSGPWVFVDDEFGSAVEQQVDGLTRLTLQGDGPPIEELEADYMAIANAPDDIRYLLDEVKRLRELCDVMIRADAASRKAMVEEVMRCAGLSREMTKQGR